MAYFKTTIRVEILSDGPYPDGVSLSDMAYDITDGECSGQLFVDKVEELSREQMSEALLAQGSDPAFLLGEEE